MKVIMHIEKDYLIKSKVNKVWGFISDPKKFGTCVPNVEYYKEINSKHYIVIVKPQFVFLKTKITMDWKVISLGKNSGKLRIKGKTIGSTFDVITKLNLLEKKGSSILRWGADVLRLEGILKVVPNTVIGAIGIKLADDIFNCVGLKTKE